MLASVQITRRQRALQQAPCGSRMERGLGAEMYTRGSTGPHYGRGQDLTRQSALETFAVFSRTHTMASLSAV